MLMFLVVYRLDMSYFEWFLGLLALCKIKKILHRTTMASVGWGKMKMKVMFLQK